MDRPWTTAFFKHPVGGPVWVGRLNIEGDRQADVENHGGIDKAVLAYSADHYEVWRHEICERDLPYGAFGENLTIAGLVEDDVCIGDIWRAGNVLLQVSQPRQPCWKLGRWWRRSDLPKRVVATGRSGWYLRVLEEGAIQPADDFRLVERPHADWSVARASDVFYKKGANRSATLELAALDELSAAWRRELLRHVAPRSTPT